MTSISAGVSEVGAGSEARTGASFVACNWGWFVVRGVLAVILGIVAFCSQ
jgi:uncharacterized membrane protein HdeD (DUF308 family)